MNIFSSTKKIIEQYISPEQLIPRLLASWFLIGFLFSTKNSDYFTLEYISQAPVGTFVLQFVFVFFALCILKQLCKFDSDMLLLGGASMLYSIELLSTHNNPYIILGVCLFQVLYCYYYGDTFRRYITKIGLEKKTTNVLIVFLAVAITAIIAVPTICRYNLTCASTFDMGIFSQMFYNMKEHGTMITTCERNRFLSHLNVHTSLFFYILLPIYWLLPNPRTLLVLQAGAITVGCIPLLLLCKHFRFSAKATLAFLFIYAFSPATWGGCFYDFHENVFLIPTLLFLFYCYEKNYFWRTMLMAVLVCSIKEDATLFIIVFGLYVLIGKKDVKKAISLLLLGVAWMLGAFAYLSKNGEGLMTFRYDILTADGSVLGILKTLLTNPGYLITQMFTPEKFAFLIALLLPVAAMIFTTKKYSRFILFIPFIFINLLTSNGYMYNIFFQYIFGPYMFLLYVSILNTKDQKRSTQQLLLLVCAYITLFTFSGHISQKTYYIKNAREKTEEIAAIQDMNFSIPDDASVSASTFLLTQLSQRDEIYMLDDEIVKNQTIYATDYAIFDLRPGFTNEQLEGQIELYKSCGYTEYASEDNVYLILEAAN